MQGNRDHPVELAGGWQCIGQPLPQRLCQRVQAAVLEQVNQLPQASLVGAAAEHFVKRPQTGPAGTAAAFRIQRVRVFEGCPTRPADVSFGKTGRRLEAGVADRDPAEAGQQRAANAAIIRKNERKQAARNPR